jgi:hypothetical protein
LIPFLPFSFDETCVGAHKYLLELAADVHRPVNTTAGAREQLLGNIRLKIRLVRERLQGRCEGV